MQTKLTLSLSLSPILNEIAFLHLIFILRINILHWEQADKDRVKTILSWC